MVRQANGAGITQDWVRRRPSPQITNNEGELHRAVYSMTAMVRPVPNLQPERSLLLSVAKFVFVASKSHRSSSRENGPDVRVAPPTHWRVLLYQLLPIELLPPSSHVYIFLFIKQRNPIIPIYPLSLNPATSRLPPLVLAPCSTPITNRTSSSSANWCLVNWCIVCYDCLIATKNHSCQKLSFSIRKLRIRTTQSSLKPPG